MTDAVRPNPIALIAVGLAAGVLSGMFGIGGGVILVPLLLGLFHFDPRLAAGTSVAAILPAAAVGGLSYGIQGNVDWFAAILLIIGIVVGAQVGSYLLSRIPTGALRWMFVAFLLVTVVSLWFVVPQRDDVIEIGWLSGVMLVLAGCITGILSGLLGIGGGVVVVPTLMFFFGASDLVAKGTSLVAMVPGSISGTLGNLRRRNVDIRAALYIGVAAGMSSPLGTFVSNLLDPKWSNITFSVLIVFIIVQMVTKMLRKK